MTASLSVFLKPRKQNVFLIFCAVNVNIYRSTVCLNAVLLCRQVNDDEDSDSSTASQDTMIYMTAGQVDELRRNTRHVWQDLLDCRQHVSDGTAVRKHGEENPVLRHQGAFIRQALERKQLNLKLRPAQCAKRKVSAPSDDVQGTGPGLDSLQERLHKLTCEPLEFESDCGDTVAQHEKAASSPKDVTSDVTDAETTEPGNVDVLEHKDSAVGEISSDSANCTARQKDITPETFDYKESRCSEDEHSLSTNVVISTCSEADEKLSPDTAILREQLLDSHDRSDQKTDTSVVGQILSVTDTDEGCGRADALNENSRDPDSDEQRQDRGLKVEEISLPTAGLQQNILQKVPPNNAFASTPSSVRKTLLGEQVPPSVSEIKQVKVAPMPKIVHDRSEVDDNLDSSQFVPKPSKNCSPNANMLSLSSGKDVIHDIGNALSKLDAINLDFGSELHEKYKNMNVEELLFNIADAYDIPCDLELSNREICDRTGKSRNMTAKKQLQFDDSDTWMSINKRSSPVYHEIDPPDFIQCPVPLQSRGDMTQKLEELRSEMNASRSYDRYCFSDAEDEPTSSLSPTDDRFYMSDSECVRERKIRKREKTFSERDLVTTFERLQIPKSVEKIYSDDEVSRVIARSFHREAQRIHAEFQLSKRSAENLLAPLPSQNRSFLRDNNFEDFESNAMNDNNISSTHQKTPPSDVSHVYTELAEPNCRLKNKTKSAFSADRVPDVASKSRIPQKHTLPNRSVCGAVALPKPRNWQQCQEKQIIPNTQQKAYSNANKEKRQMQRSNGHNPSRPNPREKLNSVNCCGGKMQDSLPREKDNIIDRKQERKLSSGNHSNHVSNFAHEPASSSNRSAEVRQPSRGRSFLSNLFGNMKSQRSKISRALSPQRKTKLCEKKVSPSNKTNSAKKKGSEDDSNGFSEPPGVSHRPAPQRRDHQRQKSDELEKFVRKDYQRIEKIVQRHRPRDDDDSSFDSSSAPHATPSPSSSSRDHSEKLRFCSSAEIYKQLQAQIQPPKVHPRSIRASASGPGVNRSRSFNARQMAPPAGPVNRSQSYRTEAPRPEDILEAGYFSDSGTVSDSTHLYAHVRGRDLKSSKISDDFTPSSQPRVPPRYDSLDGFLDREPHDVDHLPPGSMEHRPSYINYPLPVYGDSLPLSNHPPSLSTPASVSFMKATPSPQNMKLVTCHTDKGTFIQLSYNNSNRMISSDIHSSSKLPASKLPSRLPRYRAPDVQPQPQSYPNPTTARQCPLPNTSSHQLVPSEARSNQHTSLLQHNRYVPRKPSPCIPQTSPNAKDSFASQFLDLSSQASRHHYAQPHHPHPQAPTISASSPPPHHELTIPAGYLPQLKTPPIPSGSRPRPLLQKPNSCIKSFEEQNTKL